MTENQKREPKARKGFACISPERQREIASLGGRAAHLQGVAHQWSRQEAVEAGKKGGLASGKKRSSERVNSQTLL